MKKNSSNQEKTSFYGTDLSDVLYGTEGADIFIGGQGDDVYYVNNTDDEVIENKDEGSDYVYSYVNYTLGNDVEGLVLLGSENLNGTGNSLDNCIIGNSGNNTLSGGAGNDYIYGDAGNDKLYGEDGDDYLDGASGKDLMAGGKGNDCYVVDNKNDVVTEKKDEGIDYVYSSINYTLGNNVEGLVLLGSENLNGTGNSLDNTIWGNTGNNVISGGAGNDCLYGDAGNDTIYGGTGNDYMDGGTGSDVMTGGKGDDAYIVDDKNDVVVEKKDEGNDTVGAFIDYTLGNNLENLVLNGSENLNGTGNSLDNAIYGNTGNNILSGGDGNDYMYADAGNDTIYGGSGNDGLDGGAGIDTMIGGKGDDSYGVDNPNDVIVENADEGNDWVYSGINYTLGNNLESLILYGDNNLNGTGNSLDNYICGNSGNNILSGGDGSDYLDGSLGADTMIGGTGNDYIIVDNKDDVVIENKDEGSDCVYSYIDYTLGENLEGLVLLGTDNFNGTGNSLDNFIYGNYGNNILSGGDGGDYFYGDSGKDTIYGGNGDDGLDGGLDADTLIGGAGNDCYVIDNTKDIIIENADEGIDWVYSSINYTLGNNVEGLILYGDNNINGTGNSLDNTISANTGNNILSGGAGNDCIYGEAGNDTLYGGDGDDYLHGGEGKDKMIGGKGHDGYIVDSKNDVVLENKDEGSDTVVSYINYTLGNNLEGLVLAGAENLNGNGNSLDNYIYGNTGNNKLSGGAGNDYIYGDAGNDTIHGGTGNDYIDGSAGNDKMIGGDGDDNYCVDSKNDVIIEKKKEGFETVFSNVDYTLGDNLERVILVGSDNLNATGNSLDNYLIGNDGNNILSSGSGNDYIDGGLGADTMIGGTGDDVYVVDNISDKVIENKNEGSDCVYSYLDYTLGDTLEGIVLVGTENLKAIGNDLDNYLYGNTGNNLISGGAGNDYIYGDAGADTMIGGTGNDYFIVDNNADVVIENNNEGSDWVYSSMNYTLGDDVESLALMGEENLNGTGNNLNNCIIGNLGNNILIGGDGSDYLDGSLGIDKMIGGTGDDTYVVDNKADVIIENENEGSDCVYSSIDYTIGNTLEGIVLMGNENLKATGNDLDNYLYGNAGNNIIFGGAGSDYINGAEGKDKMIGGEGNDVFCVDNKSDVVVENLNEGFDYVYSSINFTLGNNLEALVLTGEKNLDGNGNSLDNSLFGNNGKNNLSGGAGNDYIDGGLGADKMTGGIGDDAYVVDNKSDVVIEKKNEGTDCVYSYINYNLGNNLEGLVLIGTDNVNAAGNSLDNYLYGNTGNNIISGGAGNDFMYGDAGKDIYKLGKNSGLDSINNYSTDLEKDSVQFDSDILKNNIAIWQNGDNLEIDFGLKANTDMATICNQTSADYKVDKFELSNGLFLTDNDINKLIQDISAYASNNNIVIDSVQDVKENDTILAMVASSWHS